VYIILVYLQSKKAFVIKKALTMAAFGYYDPNSLSRQYKLHPVPLSKAGNPILVDDEVEIKIAGGVSVLEQNRKQAGKILISESLAFLTSHRILTVVDLSSSKVGWGFYLCDVGAVDDCSTFFSRSSRISFLMRTEQIEIGLKFPSKGSEKDDFLTQCQRALQRKSWESSTAASKKTEDTTTFSASNSGVAGIIRRQEQQMKEYDSVTREALNDLDSLMKRAKEVATVAQRCAAYAASKQKERDRCTSSTGHSNSASQSDKGDEDIEGTGEEISDILDSFGIASPVTRSSAGRLYHQQLARQLAEFLLDKRRLERMGGMATLTDIYGIFNRARGTELVSPEDLLRASELIGSLGLGIAAKNYPSGVKTLQFESFDEKYVSKKLLDLCKSEKVFADGGISATDVSRRLQISIVLAKELLISAESRGMLCRDDTIEGLAFFPNRFLEAEAH
jgi:ESCRT-II complex subunit VPS36